MSGKILIVDDEEGVRFFVADGLLKAGWEVDEAEDGKIALALLAQKPYDVALLDLQMPNVDGLTVMRQMKQNWPETRIIIMTAYASLESAIEAVRQGAFDYLSKPCRVGDILACANRALQERQSMNRQHRLIQEGAMEASRAAEVGTGSIYTGQLTIELGSRKVFLANQPIALTPTEYALLEILANSLGQPVFVEQLIRKGLNFQPDDPQALETLRVHISRLRQKIGADYILTVRGGAYALVRLQT
ncbi:MAG: response regulator transcription factor [Chloroflexi bacterium]|nr:response regulator transcription factor [Chloroflexota bacterium]MCI0575189.1 response regulator transcription factor [Chloroflexota bacterium]MCI0647129.1 response regulator transcription factor [Chloroflexota bacterium]MCI0729995.1 response regulator transcription factor [Chloroflexota bacterium]